MKNFEKNNKKSLYYSEANMKTERMTKSKKIFALVLSALMFASIVTGIFVGWSAIAAANSSFNAECSVFYDIESDQTEFNYTGIKVETKLDSSLTQEVGIEINDTKYSATSPLLDGYYVVDIKGLTCSTNYTVKPYYKDKSGNYVYASDYSFTTDSGYTIKSCYCCYAWPHTINEPPLVYLYTKSGATTSFGQRTDCTNGWNVLGFDSDGNSIRTSNTTTGWDMSYSLGGTVYSTYNSGRTDLGGVKVSLVENKIDVWRVPQLSSDGKLVTIKYYLRNISGSTLSDFKFGNSMLLSLQDYNKNSSVLNVTRTEYGLQVLSKLYKEGKFVKYTHTYAFALNEGYCDTPVDAIWVGSWDDLYSYSLSTKSYPDMYKVFEGNDVADYRTTGSTDGAVIAYSWKNIVLASGETKEFSASSGFVDGDGVLEEALSNLTGVTLKNGEETTLDDGNGVTIKNTYSGTDTDHYVLVREGKPSTGKTTVEVKKGGKVKIGDKEYVAGDSGASIVVGEDITLTSGSVKLDEIGKNIKIDGKTVKNDGNGTVVVGVSNTGGGYFTIPSNGAATFDNFYKNNGTKDITVTFDGTGNPTLSLPNNGSLTIGDGENAETYNAGKKGATIIVDGTDRKITSGAVWLDIDQSIKIGNKTVQNNYNDTIIVSATDENGGYFTIPSNSTVTVDGKKICADKEADVVITDSGTTITIPAGGRVTIDGKEIVGDESNETTVNIDDGGEITVTISSGCSATIDGKTISAQTSNIDVSADTDSLTVTIPAGKSATVCGNTYTADSSSDVKIKVSGEGSTIKRKLIWGAISLEKGASIEVCSSSTTVTNTSETGSAIVVRSKDSGTKCTVNVPYNCSFTADSIPAKNISESKKDVTFEIDEKGNVSANGLLNQQTVSINGKTYRGLDLSEVATGSLDGGYNAAISIPKDSSGNPFKVYSIYFTGTSFSISTQKGGTFSNGVCGSNNVSSITTSSLLTSVQYTVKDGATLADVNADLSAITYKGAGTVSITAAQYAPKDGDVYYNGHYYRLYSTPVNWNYAMNNCGNQNDTSRYPGYKMHPITPTTDGENKMLITILKKCQASDSANGRIWLGAVPSGATLINSNGLPNAGYTSASKGSGNGWKWIWNTPENGKPLPSGNNYWNGQPDGSSAAPTYVIYIGINGTTMWDDLNEGNALNDLKLAYFVGEYSPYDSDTGSWILGSDGYSATSGFSNVQSISRTYDESNVAKLSDGQSLDGYSGKSIENPKNSVSDTITVASNKTGKTDTATIPTKGGKIVIDGKEYTTNQDNTIIAVTADGVIKLTGGSVILSSGESIKVGDKTITNSGGVDIIVTSGGEVTIPTGGSANIGGETIVCGENNGLTATIESSGTTVTIPAGGKVTLNGTTITSGDDSEIGALITGDGLIVTMPNDGDIANINGTEYTAKSTDTKISVTADGNSLTQGAVVIDKDETVNVGNNVAVTATTAGQQIIVTKKNDGTYWATVPVGGSFSAGNNKFTNTDDSEVEIEIGTDGTLILPKGTTGKVSGKITVITEGEDGEDKTTTVEIPSEKEYTYNGDTEQIDGVQKGDEISIDGLTKIIGEDGSVSLDSNNQIEGSDDEITVNPVDTDVVIYVKNPTGDGNFDVLIPSVNTGNTTITQDGVTIDNEGDTVTVNGKEYKAGEDGATFTFDENGDLTLTDGSAEVDGGDSIGVNVGGKNVTVSAGGDGTTTTKATVTTDPDSGTGTVTVDGEGTVTIGDDTYTTGKGGAEFTIDGDGNTQLSDGSATLGECETIEANVGGTTISITSADDGDDDTTTNITVTTDKTNGTVSIDGECMVDIGNHTYTTGDEGAEFTIDENGEGSLTAGSLNVANGESVNVGNGKTTITNNNNADVSVAVDSDGNGTLTIPQNGSVTIGEGENKTVITSDATNDTTVTISSDGTATATIPNGGSIQVDGTTVSGSDGTKVEVSADGTTTVTTPTSGTNVTIDGTEYTTTKENTEIEITDNGTELVSGGVVLDNGETINANGTAIKNETTGETIDVSIDANGNGIINMPLGGSVQVDGTTVSGSDGTKVEVSADGTTTVTTSTSGSTVTIGDKDYTTTKENTEIEITDNGTELVSGGVVLDNGETINANGTAIKNETTGETIDVSIDANGNGTVTMASGGKVTVGEGDNTTTIEGDNNTQVEIAADGTTTVTTPTSGTNVTIDGTEYTTGQENTKIEVAANGTELVSGGVVLDNGETINVNGTIVKNIAEGSADKTVDVKVTDDGVGNKKSTITVSDGGTIRVGGSVMQGEGGTSTLIGGTTIKGADGADTQVVVDEQGNTTVTIPDGKTIEVNGTIISGSNGTTVTIDQLGTISVTASTTGGTITVGDNTYETTQDNTQIEITDDGNKLTSGGVKVDGTDTIICGDGTTVQKPTSGTGDVTVTVDGSGKGTIQVTGNGSVIIDNITYTAGVDDTTFGIDDNGGVQIKKGSVTLDGNSEVKVGDALIDNQTGSVTIEGNGDGSGKVTISDGGSAEINGKTITGEEGKSVEVEIDTDGKATLDVGTDDTVTVDGTTLSGGTFTIDDTGITVGNGATLTGTDGQTTVKGIEKDSSDANAKDTKVEIGTDGTITLVEGKSEVSGGTVSVSNGSENIEVTVPTGKNYIIDADNGTVNGLGNGDAVTIGGITYTSGSDNGSFSIEDTALSSGDKATIPQGTDASISISDSATSPNIIVSGDNDTSTEIEKTESGATVTIGSNGDKFTVGGKTYMAGEGGATFTVDENGKVNLTGGTVKIEEGNKAVSIGDSTYKTGDNGASITSDGKVTDGSVKFDNGSEVKVGNSNTTVKNTGDTTIEVGSDGTITATEGGNVTIGSKEFDADQGTILKVDNNGNVYIKKGSTELSDGAIITGNSGREIENTNNSNITVSTDETTGKDNVTIDGTDGQVTIDGTTYTSKDEETIISVDKDGKATIESGSASVPSGKKITADGNTYTTGDNGATITSEGKITDGSVSFNNGSEVKVGQNDIVVENTGKGTIFVGSDGTITATGDGKVTVDGSEYEVSDGTVISTDNDGNVTIKEGTIGIADGESITGNSGKKIEASTGSDVTVNTDKDSEKDNITINGTNGQVTIGGTTYKSKNEETIISVDKDGKATIESGSASVPSGKEITADGNTYKTGDDGATITSGGTLTDGSVKLGLNTVIKTENGTIENMGSALISVDKDGNIDITEGVNIKVNGESYDVSGGSQLSLNKDGEVVINNGSVKITDGRSVVGASGNKIEMSGGDGNIQIVSVGTSKKDTVEIANVGGEVTIDGTTYTAGSEYTKIAVDKDGNVTLTNGTATISGGSDITAGDNTYTIGDDGATIASDGTLTDGSVKFGKDDNVKVGNNTITNVGDNTVEVDKDGNVTIPSSGEVTIGSTTYTSETDGTVITVDGNGNVTLTDGTASIPSDKEITANGNTYTTGNDGATITSDGTIIDGSVKIGKDNNVKVGNNTITNAGDTSVEVDKDGNVAVTDGGKVTIGDTTYTSESDDTVITADGNGNVTLTDGTASIPSDKKITADGNTYTTGDNGATITSDGKVTEGSVKFDKDSEVKVGNNDVVVKNIGDKTISVDSDGSVTVPDGGKVTIGGKQYVAAGDDGIKFEIGDDGNVKITSGAVTTDDGKTQIAKDGSVVGGTGNTIENSGKDNTPITVVTKNDKDYVSVPGGGTIKIGDKEYSAGDGETTYVIDEGSSVPNVIVSEDGSIDSSTELVVTKEEKIPEKIQYNISRDEVGSVVYDVSLLKDGISVQPNGKLTIRLLIPEEGKERSFRIVHLHGDIVTDVEYTIDGDYAVFTVDSLSEFSFIIDNSGSSWWLILILALIVIAEIILIIRLKKKTKNGKNDGTCLAAAAFGGVIPIPEIVFLVLLGIAAVALGVYLGYLYVKAKKAHQSEIADNATESVITENAQKATEVEEHSAEEAEDGILARFNYSLTAKLILSSEETKENFADIANYLLSYKNVKSRMSWKNLSFNHGRKCLAKIAMRGKTLWLYLALDPKEFSGSKYHGEDFSDTTKYAKVPYAVKIKSERGLKHAKELVDILMSRFSIERGAESNSISASDYAEDTQANLIKRGIIKVYSNQEIDEAELHKVKFDIRGSVRADEAKKLLDDASAKSLLVKEESPSVKKNGAIVNIDTLSACFAAGDTITLSVLKEKGLVSKKEMSVKILARGTIDKPLTVVADSFSADAIKMLVLTGGKAVIGNR